MHWPCPLQYPLPSHVKALQVEFPFHPELQLHTLGPLHDPLPLQFSANSQLYALQLRFPLYPASPKLDFNDKYFNNNNFNKIVNFNH